MAFLRNFDRFGPSGLAEMILYTGITQRVVARSKTIDRPAVSPYWRLLRTFALEIKICSGCWKSPANQGSPTSRHTGVTPNSPYNMRVGQTQIVFSNQNSPPAFRTRYPGSNYILPCIKNGHTGCTPDATTPGAWLSCCWSHR